MKPKKEKKPSKSYKVAIVDAFKWALGSTARTFRLCVLALVAAISYAVYNNFQSILKSITEALK